MTQNAMYAKVRRIQDLIIKGKPQWHFALEIREIADNCDIESNIAANRFNSREAAETWAINNGFNLTRTWTDAEIKENVYRDGNQNIYRSRGQITQLSTEELQKQEAETQKRFQAAISVNKQSSSSDISPEEEAAWQAALAKQEAAKKRRIAQDEHIDLI